MASNGSTEAIPNLDSYYSIFDESYSYGSFAADEIEEQKQCGICTLGTMLLAIFGRNPMNSTISVKVEAEVSTSTLKSEESNKIPKPLGNLHRIPFSELACELGNLVEEDEAYQTDIEFKKCNQKSEGIWDWIQGFRSSVSREQTNRLVAEVSELLCDSDY